MKALIKFLPTILGGLVTLVSPEVKTLLQDASKNLKATAAKTGNEFDSVLAEVIDEFVPSN